jgi:hypothetical protein
MTHGLRAVDPGKPPLTEVAFIAAQGHGPPTLRILVPDDQPPGIYSGVIVDRESGETRGTLTVGIADRE